jgi:hypothetical protein
LHISPISALNGHLKGTYGIYFFCSLLTLTMSSELYSKIYNFLVTVNQEHITATSVIYQGIEEDPWISQNDLEGS